MCSACKQGFVPGAGSAAGACVQVGAGLGGAAAQQLPLILAGCSFPVQLATDTAQRRRHAAPQPPRSTDRKSVV